MMNAHIFDLDGVIVSTVEAHKNAWLETFNSKGIFFNDEHYYSLCDGISRTQAIKNVLEYNSINPEKNYINELSNLKKDFYLRFIEENKPEAFADFISLIKHLYANSVDCFVCSSSTSAKYILEICSLTNFFSYVVDGKCIEENNLRAKPFPDPYLFIIEKYNLISKNTIGFEDSLSGLESLLRANMISYWINRNNSKKPTEYGHLFFEIKTLDEYEFFQK